MVRRRLSDILRAAFPRLEAALGEESFAALEEGFFHSRRLVSPFIRDVPRELLDWLVGGTVEARSVSEPYLRELAQLEWAERAVAYAEDDDGATAPLAMEANVLLTRAHRLLAFEHAVHRFDLEDPRAPEALPTRLCVYRDLESHAACVLEMTEAAHALLEELSPGTVTLREGIARAAARTGVAVDLPFIEALSDFLAELSVRGIVRGARAEIESR
jgi:hypothetical protein